MANRSGYSLARILTLGLIFHLVYIGTVFDCYFTSPVVHGMRPHRLPQAEAKRLVLIVGDGLRADFMFSANASALVPDAPERVAPYLREVIETRGAYGISHTRVPTESRPGHVAIIGGMYEDVSAVTKGWKTNPVDFDSVFNQSSHTFSFGSPDILPMFSHGATPGKVKIWCYDEEDEDFTKDATALDIWVFERLESLLRNATTNESLNAQLRQEKVVFFLHLLGLDTTGHSYRPHSKEYMNNIRVVDDLVRKTEQLISQFYGDEDTSFVFTADHGMSRIGNHGDGDPDNTRTPLIAWGAGIRGPVHASTQADKYSAPWELGHLARRDVEQADIAALMSVLLGIDWPVNSVGVLPDVDPSADGYLKMKDGEAGVAVAALTNAKVILEHYRVKHEMKEAHTLFYKPFKYFEHLSSKYPGSLEMANIERLTAEGRFSESRRHSAELITASLQGLRYLETYDRTLIRIIVTVAYTGWIAFSALYILVPRTPSASRTLGSPAISFLSVSTLLAFWALFALQKSAWTLYIYIVFPVYFWHWIIEQSGELISFWRRREHTTPLAGSKLAIGGVLVVAALQSMVLGYTHRAIWSVGFVLIGIVWPAISWPKNMVSQHWRLYLSWASACAVTAVFPLLRVDPAESTGVIMLGGLCMLLAGLIGARHVLPNAGLAYRELSNLLDLQLVLILASMSVTASSIRNLQAKTGLPLMNQVLGWVVLVTASLLPVFMHIPSTSGESKFLIYVLTFCPCFIILSIRAEGLFYLSYCVTLFFWIKVEEAVRARTTHANKADVNDKAENSTVHGEGREARGHWNPNKYRLDDVRIALFFLFFVQVGFFGTGNVASISSFYLEPVYRLVPIFSPFLMASLLLFKILAPYVLLSVAFATVNARVGMPPFALFLVALTLTDGMTTTFFFNVTDSGSWLQIGQSISHFCITSLLLVFSAAIAAAGEHLMREGDTRSGEKAE